MEFQQMFNVNYDLLIETFSEYPERIHQLTPLIEKMTWSLNEKGYDVKADDYSGIPESVTIRKRKNGDQPSSVFESFREDFISSCEQFGIKQLFE